MITCTDTYLLVPNYFKLNRLLLPGHVDESAALSLLARHYVDRDAAFLTFGDPTRLQRDALGDAGAQYLYDLLPQPIEGVCSLLGRTGIQSRHTTSQSRHTTSKYDRYRTHVHPFDMKA